MRLTFELRPDRKDREGRHPIRLRVEQHGQQQRLGTGLAVQRVHWDAPRQRVKASHPAAAAINDRLRAFLEAVEVAVLRGQDPAHIVQQGPQKGASLAQAWAALIEAAHTSEATKRASRPRVASLAAFDPAITAGQVTREWVLRYAAWLKAQGYAPNTVADRVKRLRMAVDALRTAEGLPPLPELRKLGLRGEDTGHKQLNPQQVAALLAVPTRNRWERLALDLWGLSFYLGGMRFGDLVRMDRGWIRDGWLEYRQSKTGAVRTVPLLPQAVAILDRYPAATLWNPLVRGGMESVKWQGNVLVNRALKVLAARAGIAAPVSMHWARHSFAEWALVCGVPPLVIQQVLGHANFRTTQVYLQKINRGAVGDAFAAMFGASPKDAPK